MSGLTLTPDQSEALSAILDWLETRRRIFTLGGLAGTGKTTLVRLITRHIRGEFHVLAPTGKAASVLGRKGVRARTLHGFLYLLPRETPDGTLIWTEKGIEGRGVLIVDEASMVSCSVFESLRAMGYRLLFVGDHGQLPPVGPDPRLMRAPMARLETPCRQAAESAILRFAHDARRGALPVETTAPDLSVRHLGEMPTPGEMARFDQIIVATNGRRVAINRTMRAFFGRRGVLDLGDKVVCLRNDRERGLMNGELFCVVSSPTARGGIVRADLESEDGEVFRSVPMLARQFGQRTTKGSVHPDIGLFDHGYAITCHKAQGSEWDSVLVIEDAVGAETWDAPRWRYTAATRASLRLTFISPFAVSQERAA